MAFLLAAGPGTRRRPLTDTVPRCMVPVGRRAFPDIGLDAMAGAEALARAQAESYPTEAR